MKEFELAQKVISKHSKEGGHLKQELGLLLNDLKEPITILKENAKNSLVVFQWHHFY